MSKPKTPELSDWRVTYLAGGFTPAPVTVRATSLRVRDGAVILEDAYKQPLFTAPVASAVVQRLEPGEAEEPCGEHVPAVQEAPKELGDPPAWPEAAPGQSGPGKLADPGPVETSPAAGKVAPRPRSSRRGK